MTFKMTIPTARVLAIMATEDRPWYAQELRRLTGLESGTVSPMLRRLHDDGYLDRMEEKVDTATRQGALRSYYEFTDTGRALAEEAKAYLKTRCVPVLPEGHAPLPPLPLSPQAREAVEEIATYLSVSGHKAAARFLTNRAAAQGTG